MSSLRAPSIRFPVNPGDVPAGKAARRLHLSEAEFTRLLPQLLQRGFPRPDTTTGMYDLDAIDMWRKSRHPDLFPEARNQRTEAMNATLNRAVIKERINRLGTEDGPQPARLKNRGR